jgi:hypothetical protein
LVSGNRLLNKDDIKSKNVKFEDEEGQMQGPLNESIHIDKNLVDELR